jgi:SecY translocase
MPSDVERGDRRGTRGVVTVAALAAAALAARIPLPGWDDVGLPDPGALATGLGPIVSAFILVEISALAVPAFRPLRHGGPRGRGRLTLAAYVVAALLASFQAWAIVRLASGAGALSPGAPRAAALATMAAGPFLLAALAAWIDARGLGNGLALLSGLGAATELAVGATAAGSVGPAALALPAAAIAIATWLFVRALRDPAAPPGAEAPAIPVPSCGIAPLVLPAAVLAFGPVIAAWIPGFRLAHELLPGTQVFHVSEAVLALALVPLLTILFNRTGPLLRSLASTAEDGGVSLARAARRRATIRSAFLFVAVLALGQVLRANGSAAMVAANRGFASAVVVAAVVLDLLREWRARRGAAWTAVWPLHRALEAEPTVARLGAAGIPAFVRGAGFRTLYQFFAPYAPVVVFVPPEHAEAATALLHEWHSQDR